MVGMYQTCQEQGCPIVGWGWHSPLIIYQYCNIDDQFFTKPILDHTFSSCSFIAALGFSIKNNDLNIGCALLILYSPLFIQNNFLTKMKSMFWQLLLIFALGVLSTSKTCGSSQYYGPDGSCGDCPANCNTCSAALFCTQCKQNYYLVSFDFNSTCQTCNQLFTGCKTCLSNLACSVCNDGYFMLAGTCRLCSTKNIFCFTCTPTGDTCTQCSYPYVLSNGFCVSPSSTSDSPKSDNGFPSNGSSGSSETKEGDNLIKLGNGSSVSPVLDQNGCNQLQIFFQEKCIKKIPNCNKYQSNGLCSQCNQKYLVTILGDCSIKNSKLACESGFWLDKVNDRCVAVSPACDWYYPSNGSCVNCTAGYTLKNGSCLQGIKCNERQFFFLGACVTVPSECITFDKADGTCTTCASGYNLNSGLCIKSSVSLFGQSPCKFPCKTCHFDNLGFCFSCQPLWMLSRSQYGSCVPVPK